MFRRGGEGRWVQVLVYLKLTPSAIESGGDSGVYVIMLLRYHGIGLLFIRYVGNLNLNMQYCSII